jgi:hypothetical protein
MYVNTHLFEFLCELQTFCFETNELTILDRAAVSRHAQLLHRNSGFNRRGLQAVI